MVRKSNYDKFPVIAVPDGAGAAVTGIENCGARLREAIAERAARKAVLVVECYPGVDTATVIRQFQGILAPVLSVNAAEAMLPADKIDALVEPFLGDDDPIFGFLCDLALPQFFDPGRLDRLRRQVAGVKEGLVLVAGCGARLIADGDILVYSDLSRWEAQKRFRRNEASNLGVENRTLAASLQYKRAFFVDWRVADRWKRPLIAQWDYVLD
ncbi:MAG: mannose-6-phosphate isomerase, partial [Limisphaerales bacterium]